MAPLIEERRRDRVTGSPAGPWRSTARRTTPLRIILPRPTEPRPGLTSGTAAVRLTIALSLLAAGGCRPNSTRPPFPPVPEAASTEIRLTPTDAVRLLAEALKADSIPPARVELRDTWLETRWFDAATGAPARHRPIGAGTVRVRAWADPTHPGNSKVVVETVYRPVVDPSVPERELDREVPRNHPVALKVRATLQELVKRYGGPPKPAEAAGGGNAPADERAQPESDEPADESPDTPPDTSQ